MSRWYWHIHHNILAELAIEPIANRRRYIRKTKPEHERATRLRWLTSIRGTLPAALAEASQALAEAWRAQDEVIRAYAKADRALAEASWAALPELGALHAVEHPGCPWDGTTLVFPEDGR